MELYFCDIGKLSAELAAAWLEQAAPERRQRIKRLQNPDGQKRSLVSDHLARLALSRAGDCAPEELVFGQGTWGKPFVCGQPLHYNISHSGAYVVCAVSRQPVGVDVELIRPAYLPTVRRFCTAAEQQYLFGHLPEPAELVDARRTPVEPVVLQRFFELWTAKEAYCKFTGRGIGEELLSYCVVQNGCLTQRFQAHGARPVRLLTVAWPSGYQLALVWPADSCETEYAFPELPVFEVNGEQCRQVLSVSLEGDRQERKLTDSERSN